MWCFRHDYQLLFVYEYIGGTHEKIIDSVFRNIVVWFSLILVSFLAVVSFLFTSVFEWDESNQYLPEVIHYKSDIFIITLAVCVLLYFYYIERNI